MSDEREIAVRQALVASFAIMRRVQRNVPDLDATDRHGRSVVVDTHVMLLLQAVPAVEAADVADAARAHMTASAFFPTPAELIEQVRQVRRHGAEARGAERRLALPPTVEAAPVEAVRSEALANIAAIVASLQSRMTPERRFSFSAATLDEHAEKLHAEDARVKAEIRRRVGEGESVETLAIEYGITARAARIIAGGLRSA